MSVTFQNRGILDFRGLTTFGLSAKPESTNPIGYFGTGLKYAIAVLLRHKCAVSIWFGDKEYEVFPVKDEFRGEVFEEIYMNDDVLPFTTSLGKNWELWMAYRELYANTVDEPEALITDEVCVAHKTCTTIQVHGEAFDKIYKNHDDIFLCTRPSIVLKGIEIHDVRDVGNWIFYKGIRVHELPKQALFTYNITANIRLTEDRTLASMSDFYKILSKAVVKCDHPSLIRALLLANSQYFESQIDYNWWSAKPGETFNSIVTKFINSRTSFNSSAKDLHRSRNPKVKPPATIQVETIPMDQRRKLWAALLFWEKLGLEIPKRLVHVTNDSSVSAGRVVGGHLYLARDTLSRDMRFVTGFIYELYCDSKPHINGVKQKDLFLDTLVTFGERLLGMDQKKSA